MSDHSVRIEFDRGFITKRLVCNAPERSLCHAQWSCECESWACDGVTDEGVPWHSEHDANDPLSPSTERHVGTLDATICGWRDWFDLDDGQCLDGVITAPVKATWAGECPWFEIVKAAES